MRNRALHDALRDFALESAALLSDELRGGAEIEFDVLDEGGGRGPALYRYRPRTAEFVAARWEDLRALSACSRAGEELGAGASLWLRENGMGGERAEPALRAMLERLYEDATSFGFPEERFERLYEEVEQTLYRDAVRTRVAAPLRGLLIEPERVDFDDGLALVRGDRAQLPPEAAWAEDGPLPQAVCVLERETDPDDPLRAAEVEAGAARLVTALRLLRAGAVGIGPVAWRRSGEGRHSALALTGDGGGRAQVGAGAPRGTGTHVGATAPRGTGTHVGAGAPRGTRTHVGAGAPRGTGTHVGATAPRGTSGEPWVLVEDDVDELRDLVRLLAEEPPSGAVAWALRRFELGCARPTTAEALSDYLLALRALLDATSDAGEASLALRVAALCAEEGRRGVVARRIELAVALERFVMRGGGHLDAELRAESAPELVAELEGHLRALLRDTLCGYLDTDLKGVADDILLESREPFEIAARDLRVEAPGPAASVPAPAPAAAPEVAAEPRDGSAGRSVRRREWFEEPDEFVEGSDEGLEEPDELVEEEADTREVPALAVAPPVPRGAPAPTWVPVPRGAVAPTRVPPLDDEPIRVHRAERFPRSEPVEDAQQTLEGVTPSADWGCDDPEDFSAPI